MGIVLPVLRYSLSLSHGDVHPDELHKSFYAANATSARRLESDEEQDSMVASSLLAGMIFGQLFGGYLGDVLGRRNAMLFVMLLQIGGSLGAALFVGGEWRY